MPSRNTCVMIDKQMVLWRARTQTASSGIRLGGYAITSTPVGVYFIVSCRRKFFTQWLLDSASGADDEAPSADHPAGGRKRGVRLARGGLVLNHNLTMGLQGIPRTQRHARQLGGMGRTFSWYNLSTRDVTAQTNPKSSILHF